MRNRASMGLFCVLFTLACTTPGFDPVARPLGYEPGGSCTPQGGPPSDAALQESAGLAEKLVEDSLATLGNEYRETRRQFIHPKREPLQRFPRLTFPAMADPTPIEAGGARKTPSWLVPLILDEQQLGDIPVDAVTSELRFWLVPHGADVAETVWRDVTECLVRAGSRGSVFASDDERRPALRAPGDLLPTLARTERLRGLAFEIPTRTATRGMEIAPGFYDLRVLPRLNSLRDVTVRTPQLEAIRSALQEGDWSRALGKAIELEPAHLAGPDAVTDLQAMAKQVARTGWNVTFHPAPHFDLDLKRLREVMEKLAKQLKAEPENRGAMRLALSRLEQPMRNVLVARQSVAPVALKDRERERGRCGGDDCIRVAVAGDFQYHGDLSALRRFLGMLDPEFVQAASPGAPAPGSSAAVPDVDFVLFAGDLADGAAGSARDQLVLNVLGVLPPTSPYGPDGGNEMPEIRDQLAHFQKPFFAVPGNHDGYSGYGGLLNIVFDELGFVAEETFALFGAPRLGRGVGDFIKRPNDFIPTFVGLRMLNRHPRYDGLGQYQTYLGPLNLAFEFRGHSFVGVNSYDLKPSERAAVGGVVLHWGGGLQDRSIDWLDDMLNRFAPASEHHEQFIFMHHDPRGAVPTKAGYAEQQFGLYDAIDTPISQLTLGHVGLGNSPRTGLYLPVVSFLGTFLWRGLEIGFGDDAGTFQQEWMRKPDWGWSFLPAIRWPRFFDHEAYNAKPLVELINCNLAGATAPGPPRTSLRHAGPCDGSPTGISQVLFAHDNVPAEAEWADRRERGAVFREPTTGQLWRPGWQSNSIAGQFGGLFGLKFRNGSPPEWAQHMRLGTNQGNARVLRMDDIGDHGNYHGFHVITLYDDEEREPDTQWFALPR